MNVTYPRSKSSGTHSLLLATAAHLGVKSDSGLPADVECSDAFWPVDLVATDRQQVNVHFINVDGHLTDTLSCVCMEKHFVFAANLSNLFDRLDSANLVVDVND